MLKIIILANILQSDIRSREYVYLQKPILTLSIAFWVRFAPLHRRSAIPCYEAKYIGTDTRAIDRTARRWNLV